MTEAQRKKARRAAAQAARSEEKRHRAMVVTARLWMEKGPTIYANTAGGDVAMANLFRSMIRASVKAALPGRQSKRNVQIALREAEEAARRVIRRAAGRKS